MAKVGLKDTLALLAKGYSKKDIDALAAIDEENEKAEAEKKAPEVPTPVITDSDPAPAAEESKEPEIDYKALYEEQLKQSQESLEKLKKLQEQNIHKNMAPDAAAQLEKQTDALLSMVRDFM